MRQSAPNGQPSLDPAVLQAIRASAYQLIQERDAFIQQLQSHITAMPDFADFRTLSGPAFCQQLGHALLWAAVTDQPPYVVADALRQMGATNRLAGFPEEHYVSVAHALVRTVRDFSGYDWAPSMSSAWITYFQWIRAHLIFGAQQAAARQDTVRVPDPPQDSRGRSPQTVTGDADLESVAGLLDAEDSEDSGDEDGGYGQIMLSMTFN